MFAIVVIRESVSEINARLKDFIHLFLRREVDPISLVETSQIFSKYVQTPTFETRNLVLLDNFPIYRWAIPNILLAHHIARDVNAKVGVFSFRQPIRSSRSLYKKLFVDELIVIKLTLTQKIYLIREYRKLIKYLQSNKPLIDYRITGIGIGLDIYESILRSGLPTINLFDRQTYRSFDFS